MLCVVDFGKYLTAKLDRLIEILKEVNKCILNIPIVLNVFGSNITLLSRIFYFYKYDQTKLHWFRRVKSQIDTMSSNKTKIK